METKLKEIIYTKTNGGKDIFVDCLGFSPSDFDGKKFKAREESDASAHFRLIDGVWKFKDFGTSSAQTDAVGKYAETNALTYSEALHKLAEMYGISQCNNSQRKPRIEYTPITEEIRERGFQYDFKDQPTKSELSFLGPIVTKKVLESLHYKSVSCYKFVSDDKVVNILSDEYNMFFCRECRKLDADGNVKETFFKNYQPRSDAFKFSYQPTGMSPGECVHGEYELIEGYKVFNEKEESIFKKNHPNKEYKEQKLDCAVICSGERDALCVKAFGFNPIWLNSETQELTEKILGRIKRYVHKVFFLPDCDETGIIMGRKKAFQFPELYTIWLPRTELQKRIGDQKKPMKDFRDWCETHRNHNDFEKLINNACPLQFWHGCDEKIWINSVHLLYFLSMYGYYKYKDETSNQYIFVHIIDYEVSNDNNIIEIVTLQEIRDFILRWSEEQALPNDVKDAIIKSRCITANALSDLKVREFNFKNSTETSQILTYANTSFEITAEGIYQLEHAPDCFIFKHKMVNHKVTPINEPMFQYARTENPFEDEPFYDITVQDTDCKLLKIYDHQANIHWRKQLELNKPLTEKEVYDYKKNLQNTFFTLGYLMHTYKNYAHPWIVINQDWKIGKTSDEANGGNAKSIIRQVMSKAMGKEIIDIKINNSTGLDYQHIFGSVTPNTDIIYIDETPKNFDFNRLNEETTTGINVNPKGKAEYNIVYEKSPKIVANTNYVVRNDNATGERRHLQRVVSDYFHQKTQKNDYAETRKVYDDIGGILFGENYSEEDWNKDINFLMQCMMFYFYVLEDYKDKLNPPMENIIKRQAQAKLAPGFEEFANDYFADGTHFNEYLSKANLTSEYNSGKKDKLSDREVKSNLKSWTSMHDELEFNPYELCTDKQNLRIKKIDGEYFYIKKEGA